MALWSRDLGFLRVSLLAEPRDLWVGVYWNVTRPACTACTRHWTLDVYVCVIPMLPIKVTLP